jgi:cytochrome c-type biogenesis protein CcmH/NrfF
VRRRVRSAGLLVVVAAVGMAMAAPPGGAQTRANLPDVEDEVMCPICGTLLAESASPQAERERALIRRLIAEGRDKEEIKDALVAEYGPRVLATPSGSGFDLLAWLVPGIAIGLGLCGIAWFALRRRPRRPAAAPIDPSDRAHLDEDMSRYDL